MEIPPGQIPPPAVFSRIDHCWYPESELRGTCMKLSGDLNPQPCINECRAKTHEECNGVVVIPLKPGSDVYEGFKDINLTPFGKPGCTKPGNNDPATHICYPLRSRNGSALDFEYWATTDPEDPAFYSTCYHRKKPKLGFMAPESSFDPVDWEYRGKCLSCADRRKWNNYGATPFWKMDSAHCVNCDRREKGAFAPETLHYFAFDQANGNKVVDLATDVEYTLLGNAKVESPGHVGTGALTLPGAVASRIDLGNWNVDTDQFTMAVWANFAVTDGTDPRIISKTSSDNAVDHTWALTTDNTSQARCRLRVVGVTNTIEIRSDSGAITPNNWKHWACTYKSGDRVRLFLDGVQVAQSDVTSGKVETSDKPIRIGANTNNNAPTKPMTGKIDDLRLIGKQLSAAEIQELMALKN
jgi:hypothetical protein